MSDHLMPDECESCDFETDRSTGMRLSKYCAVARAERVMVNRDVLSNLLNAAERRVDDLPLLTGEPDALWYSILEGRKYWAAGMTSDEMHAWDDAEASLDAADPSEPTPVYEHLLAGGL